MAQQYEITQEGKLYVLKSPHGITPFTTKIDGFVPLFKELLEKKITGTVGLPIIRQIMNLSIPLNEDTNDPSNEWKVPEDVFDKKAWAEKTNKSLIFMCVGCGEHAFLLGPDFVYEQELRDRYDVVGALQSLHHEGRITSATGTDLIKQMLPLPLPLLEDPLEKYLRL